MTDDIDTDALSWLDLPATAPTPEVRAVFDRTRERIGYIRNNQRVAAHRPGLLVGLDALSRGVQFAPEIGLSAREREIIALVVSSENHCEPCVVTHASLLREITGDDFFVARLSINPAHVDLAERERALVDYALAVTRHPGEIVEDDIDDLRAAGLSDGDILDAAAIAAYFNFSNRLNSAIGLLPDERAYWTSRHAAPSDAE